MNIEYNSFRQSLVELTNNFNNKLNEIDLIWLQNKLKKTINKPCLSDAISQSSMMVTGSGGATIRTVSVSSLSSLFVASLGYKIIKTGSRSYNSWVSSYDIFEKLYYPTVHNLLDTSKHMELFNFIYLHSPTIYPWLDDLKYYKSKLSEQEIKFLFERVDNNEANCKNIFCGINTQKTEEILNEMNESFYKKITIIHGMSNDPAFYIDEASTFGSTMLSFYGGKKRITEKINNYKNIKSTSFKNVLFKSKSEADSCNNLILSDIEIVRKEIVDLIILNSAYLINSFNNFEIEIDDIIDDIYTSKNLREFNIYIANMIDYNKNSMN